MRSIMFVTALVVAPCIWATLALRADQPPADKPAATAPAKSEKPAVAEKPAAAEKPATADKSPALETPEDEAAVRAAGAAFLAAYNARDAKKMAALWSPEAVYIDRGANEQVVGRPAIEKMFAEAFADKKDAKLTVETGPIDFVSPNVAVTHGIAHLTRPGEATEDSEYTTVRVKRDGQWLLDRVTEVEADKPPPSNYEHLKELEWMIGSWHDDDPNPSVEIQTDCDWAQNKNYMTRSFAVAIGDQVHKSGMQIVGWDPVAKDIRSWIFDSDGGYSEGTWSKQGPKWFIHNKGVMIDGGKTSSVYIITPIDENSFKWESVSRQIDGQLQPNVEPVLVVRKTDQ
jgi:uncharacterized protein (TIGR02246 family)